MEMGMYIHKGRNVVVARGDMSGDLVEVAFVGVAENVEGSKRRGRHPNYDKAAVKTSDLVAFDSPSDMWVERARKALSRPKDDAGMAEDNDMS